MKSLLTKIYARLLKESSARTNIAFCALNPDDSEVRMGVAYDTTKVKLPSPGQELTEADVLPAIVAVITITEPGAPKFKCNGAWKVASVAGPGKLAYGMGYYLSPTHKLIPDRKSLTQDAIDAWEKQYNLSTLEETQPIDPVDSAGNHLEDDRFHDEHHTPDPSDDCDAWETSEKGYYMANVLNRSYARLAYASAEYDFDAMLARHAAFLNTLDDPQEFEDKLFDAKQIFFDTRVGGEFHVN